MGYNNVNRMPARCLQQPSNVLEDIRRDNRYGPDMRGTAILMYGEGSRATESIPQRRESLKGASCSSEPPIDILHVEVHDPRMRP